MMEQLAERRMQREEEAQFAANGLTPPSLPNAHGHNHEPLPDEEEEFDEEEEYDSQDEDYDDEDDEPVSMFNMYNWEGCFCTKTLRKGYHD